MRVHVSGIDELLRTFDRTQERIEKALDDGCLESAEYLQEKIEDKFGTYQPGWERLKYPTIVKERKMGFGGNATKPLVMSSDMMFSFSVDVRNKTRKHTVAVTSDDEKILWHRSIDVGMDLLG